MSALQSLALSYARKLDISVRSGNEKDTKLLLSEPLLNPNIKDLDDVTLLHVAVNSGSGVLKAMLHHRLIDVNLRNKDGNSAFHLFCMVYKEPDVVDVFNLFLGKGIDLSAVNNAGETAFHKACVNNSYARELVLLLSRHGAPVNATSASGEAPLHVAVRSLREDIVYLLLAAGADPNLRLRDGRSVRDIAARSAGQTRIVDVLQRPDAYAPEFGQDHVGRLSAHLAAVLARRCGMCKNRPVSSYAGVCDTCRSSAGSLRASSSGRSRPTLLTLPLNVMIEIMRLSSDRRLCALSQTCLKLRTIAANNENWYHLCLTNCCSRCARCFKWSHTVSPIDADARGNPLPPPFGFYKNYYREKFERCINMSDQPQGMRRTMHRRCVFCSGARRDPGVPPPRLPNEPAHGEPLAHPNYARDDGQAMTPIGQCGASSSNAPPEQPEGDEEEDDIPVGASAGTMAAMMPQMTEPRDPVMARTVPPQRAQPPPLAASNSARTSGAALYGGSSTVRPVRTASAAPPAMPLSRASHSAAMIDNSGYMPTHSFGTQPLSGLSRDNWRQTPSPVDAPPAFRPVPLPAMPPQQTQSYSTLYPGSDPQPTAAPVARTPGPMPGYTFQPPRPSYEEQLGTLRNMGFAQPDHECMAALQQVHGNVDAAVSILLSGP